MEDVNERVREFMQWLPDTLAIRYHLVLGNEDLGASCLAVELICVRGTRVLHVQDTLSRLPGGGLERARVAFDENPALFVRDKLDQWHHSHSKLSPWLKPEPFVGVVSLPSGATLTPRAENQLFAFYHGALRTKIHESHRRLKSVADEVCGGLAWNADAFDLLYDRFGAFANQTQKKLEETMY